MAQHQDALNRLAEASKICDSYISESGIKVNETHFKDGSELDKNIAAFRAGYETAEGMDK